MINCTHSEGKIFLWASVQIKVLFGLMGPPWYRMSYVVVELEWICLDSARFPSDKTELGKW